MKLLASLALPAFIIASGAGALAAEPDEPETKLSLRDAIILGIVEGTTEFLPVSSTGHLLIAQDILGLTGENENAAHSLAICIQFGAILAVLLLYRGRIQQLLRGVIGADEKGLLLVGKLIAAFLPAAVLGLALRDEIKERLFSIPVVTAALLIGGILILVADWLERKRPSETEGKPLEELGWKGALLIGFCQCVAFWPGFSRSLATILGGRLANLRLSAAVEFSFLLGLMTLGAASVFEAAKSGREMVADYGLMTPLLATFVAFIAAALSIKFMIHVLARYGLQLFGYYRILLAIAVWYFLWPKPPVA